LAPPAAQVIRLATINAPGLDLLGRAACGCREGHRPCLLVEGGARGGVIFVSLRPVDEFWLLRRCR